MTRTFNTWPHTARKIVEESLREFVGDGEGEDYEVLTTFINEVQAEALRDAADDIAARVSAPSLIEAADKWSGYYSGVRVAMQNEETALRARADRLDPRGADRG